MVSSEQTPLLSDGGEITVVQEGELPVVPHKTLWQETLGILISSGPVILGMVFPTPIPTLQFFC